VENENMGLVQKTTNEFKMARAKHCMRYGVLTGQVA
jgi:hypothetical protein